MPDPEQGPQTQPTENAGLSINRPGIPQEPDEGQSAHAGESISQLPEEYKPYKEVVPWEQIPEEAREDALKGIKKFHGDLTREHQEFANIKRQLPELQEKARIMDYLSNQPEIQQAMERVQARENGNIRQPLQQPAESQQIPGLDKLNEYGFDSDAQKALNSTIANSISQAVAPLTGKISQLEQQLVDREVKDQMDALAQVAKENGLPDPQEQREAIREVLSQKRAVNISDAYFLAIKNKLPSIYTEKAQREMREKLGQKQQQTIPLGYTPATPPTNQMFSGNDAVDRALRASEEELKIKF